MLELRLERVMPAREKKEPPQIPAEELHLRRLTVEEALFKLEQYLNDAFMDGQSQVRIVHGKGTGTLRQVVWQRLSHHSLVKSYRPGEHGEGGLGVTIVHLFQRE
jgi:DNA mismatch repair protein MutS2